MFSHLVVLDFEATCCDETKNWPNEIIEWPSVLIEYPSLRKIDEIQMFVKPVKNPALTKFCTELTGITQQQVDAGISVEQALKKYTAWLAEHNVNRPLFLTCGDWDLK